MTIEINLPVSSYVQRSTQLPPASFPERADKHQLATKATRILQRRLGADLVWIGEIADLSARARACPEDNDGFGPPPVEVLATAPSRLTVQPDRAQPVLPSCLLQIAWDVASLNQKLDMSLRNPARTLSAVPVTLSSGIHLVLITVVPHHNLTQKDSRTLRNYAANIGRGIERLVTAATEPNGNSTE